MAVPAQWADRELRFCQEHSLLTCPLPELPAASEQGTYTLTRVQKTHQINLGERPRGQVQRGQVRNRRGRGGAMWVILQEPPRPTPPGARPLPGNTATVGTWTLSAAAEAQRDPRNGHVF